MIQDKERLGKFTNDHDKKMEKNLHKFYNGLKKETNVLGSSRLYSSEKVKEEVQ